MGTLYRTTRRVTPGLVVHTLLNASTMVRNAWNEYWSRNQMFTADFQGYVDKNLIVDGIVTGVALGK